MQHRQEQLIFTSTFKLHFKPLQKQLFRQFCSGRRDIELKPTAPQVGGKCSVQKATGGCLQRGCSWKRAVMRQQIPVDAADGQTASCPWTTELQPLTQQLDMCYHRDPQKCPVVERWQCGHIMLVSGCCTGHPAHS